MIITVCIKKTNKALWISGIKNTRENHSHGGNSLKNGLHSVALNKLKKFRQLWVVVLVSAGKRPHFIQ